MGTVSSGVVLGGRYELTERIAGGGMGEVWRGHDRVLGRSVALKVIKPGLADDEGFAGRFRNEARLAARLTHPNIAQVYDFGESGEQAYLVMELVAGSSVADLLESGPVPLPQVADIIEQAGAGLAAAHEEGMVHRDVKPANMLLTPKGAVKLTDFGIARALGEAKVTRTGEVLGTVQYLSPEAAMGRDVDGQSDVYALAVVAYELLAGTRPFQADSAVGLAMKHVNEPPPPLPQSVPYPVAAVVLRGLAKDPRNRPAGAVAFADELGRAARTQGVASPGARGASAGGAASSWPTAAASYPIGPPAISAPYNVSSQTPAALHGQPWPATPASYPATSGRAQQGHVARGIAWAWVVSALLTALSCFLPFGSHLGGSWSALSTGRIGEVATGTYESSDDVYGWMLLVPMLIVAAMGLPAAAWRRPHLAWPLVAMGGCIWSALVTVVLYATGWPTDYDNPATPAVGAFLIPLFGTCTFVLLIAAAIKRR